MSPSPAHTTPSTAGSPTAKSCAAHIARLPTIEREHLTQLDQALDAAIELTEGARHHAIHAALRCFAARADLDTLLQETLAPSTVGYRRHLLLADPRGRYSAVAIVWEKGQFSPVHGHHTWCAYGVVRGELSESCFDWSNAARAAQFRTMEPRLPGDVSYVEAGYGGIHRLGNLHPEPAISLHVYGVPGASIATGVNHVVEVDAGVITP